LLDAGEYDLPTSDRAFLASQAPAFAEALERSPTSATAPKPVTRLNLNPGITLSPFRVARLTIRREILPGARAPDA
jgi:hypothetical protein